MPEIETLILGSSQSLNAVNPSFLSKKAYNLANTSQSLYYDIALTEKYLDKMPKLKTVCVGIAYFSFFGEMEDTDEEWRTYYYRYFWDISCPHTEKLDARKYSLIALYGNFTALKFEEIRRRSESCQLLVAGDTSVLHFAALEGIPVAGLYLGPANVCKTPPRQERGLVI